MQGLRLEKLSGTAILTQMDALAALRIRVFRDWPYLYDGSAEYEAHYLQVYVDSPRSLALLVWDGEHCVGASTCLPLADALPDMQQPFVERGMDLSRIDYFGESVLLREYRGRGVGVEFFRQREAHAREHGLNLCAFCSVDRDAMDSRKPADYVPNDAFWTHRGYRKQPQLRGHFSWPDIGESEPSEKPMTFWMRDLDA